MSSYHIAQICKNGHVITSYADKYPDETEKYCSKCGAETIEHCPNCNNSIRGSDVEIGYYSKFSSPAYCHNCGKAFPWTQTALETAVFLIQESDDFTQDQIDKLIETLPDLIVETPKTNVAIVRMKKGLASAGKFTADGLRQFLIDFGCELTLRSFGL